MCITIMLAEDDQSIREAYCYVLSRNPGLRVVAEVGDGRAAVEEARRARPDVALIDIRLPEMNGIEATRHIHDELPGTRILALSVCDDETSIKAMIEAGAWGYLCKAVSLDELVAAIHDAKLGKRQILRWSGGKMTATFLPATSTTYQTAYDRLSPRLREVLQLIAENFSTKEIAEKLSISPDTVTSYRKHLMEKLNLHSTAALTRYAIQERLTPMNMFDTDSE